MLSIFRALVIAAGFFLIVVTVIGIVNYGNNIRVRDIMFGRMALGVAFVIFGSLLPKRVTVVENENTPEIGAQKKRLSFSKILQVMAAIAGIIGTGVSLLQFLR